MREANPTLSGISPGEPEQLTVELRECLRREDMPGAHRCFVKLTGLLTRLIQSRAEAFFDRRRDLVEDAIQEVITLLWGRLSDLRDLSGLRHFERRFYQALQSLMQDAFRAVHSRARAGYEIADTAAAIIREGEEQTTALSYASDTAAIRQLETVLGTMSANALVERIPDPKHREAFRLYVEGVPQKDIATQVNCTPRTLYNWIEAIRVSLRTYLESRLWEGLPEEHTPSGRG